MIYTEVKQAALSLHNDVQDTIAKLTEMGSLLCYFQDFFESWGYLDAQGREDAIAEFNDTFTSDVLMFVKNECVQISPVIAEHIAGFTINHAGVEKLRVYVLNRTSNVLVSELGATPLMYKPGFFKIDAPKFSTTLQSLNFSGLVQWLKSSIQVQSLFDDIAKFIGGSTTILAITTKWQGVSDWTAMAKEVFLDFLGSGSTTQKGALQWILSKLSQLENTTATDDVLDFSSTDYTVSLSWSTAVMSIAGTVLQAIAAIATAISKVAGAIAAVVTTLFSAIGQAWNSAENPVMDYYEFRRQTFCVPLFQKQSSTSPWSELAPLKGCTIDFLGFTMRYFYSSNVHGVEYMIRPVLGIEGLAATCTTVGGSAIVSNKPVETGEAGLRNWLLALEDDYGVDLNPSNVLASPTELGQATILAANMYFFMMCMSRDTYTPWTGNVAQAKAAVDDTSLSPSVRLGALFAELEYYVTLAYLQPSMFYQRDIVTEWLMCNWDRLINHIIPVMRSLWSTDAGPGGYGSVDVHAIGQQEFGSQCDKYCFPELSLATSDTYGLVPPKNSGVGFIAAIVTSVVVVAAAAAATALAVVKAKKAIAKFQLKQATKAQLAKTAYENSLKGIDNDDPTGSTTKEYTAEEQAEYFSKYYKSVKSYNRLSFLWGGTTFSLVNGWDDGATDNPVLEDVPGVLGSIVGSDQTNTTALTTLDQLYLLITGTPVNS